MIHVVFLCLVMLIPLGVFTAWYWQLGFDAFDLRWWQWLRETLRVTGTLPQDMLYALYGVSGVVLLLMALVAPLLTAARNRSLTQGGGGFRKRGSATLHGSARWAIWQDIRRAGLLGKTGVIVGAVNRSLLKSLLSVAKTSKRHFQILKHDGPEHVMAFAPTRSGKGVGLVIPTLLSWEESALILDIKGENYALTDGWRTSIGQRVIRFDPASLEGSARFNPLAEVRLGTDYEIADCQNIASMIIDPDGKGLKDYWAQSGWEWLTASLLHVLYYVNFNEGRDATLADVHQFMSTGHDGELLQEGEGDPDIETLDSDITAGDILDGDRSDGDKPDGFDILCDAMIGFDHKRPSVDQEITRAAGSMKKKALNERSGVHSSAKVALALYSDPIVSRNISECDFRIADLMNGITPTSLYIVIPPSDIDRLKPLIRIIMNQILTRLTSEMVFEGGSSVQHYKHRLLLMLDEFTSIGKLEIFERALAFMAGYGLKAFIIVQDLTQLQKVYGRDEAITSNCHVRIAYAPNRIETAKLLSDMSGKTTIVQQKKSRSKTTGKSGANISTSIQETARPLLTPDECMALPGLQTIPRRFGSGKTVRPGQMLIFTAGHPPIYGTQFLYFQDQDMQARAKIPTPSKFNEILVKTEETLTVQDNRRIPSAKTADKEIIHDSIPF